MLQRVKCHFGTDVIWREIRLRKLAESGEGREKRKRGIWGKRGWEKRGEMGKNSGKMG